MSRTNTERPTRFLRPAILVLASICGLAGTCGLSGCGDDGSDDHRGIIGTQATGTPEETWQCLERSLNEHQADGWTNAIGTTFEYVPDPVSEVKYPDAWSSWGRDEELAFAQALFVDELDFDARMNENDARCPPSQGGTVIWPAVEYSLVVSGVDGESPVTYRGVADLTFGLEGNFWYLYRWVDLYGAAAPWNENVVCPTLGELRAAYRARQSSPGS